MNFCYGSTSNGNHQLEENNECYQTPLEDVGESQYVEQQCDEDKFFVLPGEYEMDMKPVKREFVSQPTEDMNLGDSERDTHVPFMHVADNPLAGDELYLSDSYPVEYPDGFNVEDYLTFSDADEDNLMTHDCSKLMMRNDDSVSGEHLQSLEVSLSLRSPPNLALNSLKSKMSFMAPRLTHINVLLCNRMFVVKLRKCQRQIYLHPFLMKTTKLHLQGRILSLRILNQVSFSHHKVCK